MKKSDWQYLIDSLLFICITGIVFIGFLMGLFIPTGPSVSESSKYFLGLHRHDWGTIHFYLSIAFTGLVIIHLIFSWKWITAKAKQIFKNSWSSLLTLTLIIALASPFIIWSLWPKYSPAFADYGLRPRNSSVPLSVYREAAGNDQQVYLEQDGDNYILITGQTTLDDVERATGISAVVFKEKLGLPKRIKPEETLGRLKKRYGFELQDIRDIITHMMAVPSETTSDQETRIADSNPAQIGREPVTRQEAKAEEHQDEDMLTRGRLAEDQTSLLITGQMSLRDIEVQTGIQVQRIVAKLGLPSTISPTASLGRLRKLYPFTLQNVREVVTSLLKETTIRENF
jgi:hypothetical protein